MIGSLLGKVMWVGRATTLCIGLAVILAVVLGVGTMALAAVPGDPFKLGRFNTIDRITTLTGSEDRSLLKVDNNGSGAALALRSEPGNSPLTVNADAGKAINLDADRIDGKDASEFLATSGKAADSETLDGKDSSDFYAAGSKVADSGTLDGFDSGRFMFKPSGPPRTFSSTSDSSTSKFVNAACRPGEIAVNGKAWVSRPTVTTEPPPEGFPVALQMSGVSSDNDAWSATAAEMVPYEGEWRLYVSVSCAPRTDAIVYPE